MKEDVIVLGKVFMYLLWRVLSVCSLNLVSIEIVGYLLIYLNDNFLFLQIHGHGSFLQSTNCSASRFIDKFLGMLKYPRCMDPKQTW